MSTRSPVILLGTWTLAVLIAAGWLAPSAHAGDEEAAERAVATLMAPLEKGGFDFRADVWERELKPDIGKAVRVQMFKGNDYRVCIAVGEKSGAKIEAHVLDGTGKPVEAALDNRGWGIVLTVRPKGTGVYVVVINQAPGGKRPEVCAMIMGYK